MSQKSPTFIFLHGVLETAQVLRPLMDLFSARGFEVQSLNFSGHGVNSSAPSEFRVDLFARDLETHLKNHPTKDVVLFGNGLGGYVALYYQANFETSKVKKIFTYGTKFNWSEKSVSKEITMLSPDFILEKHPQIATLLKERHGEGWRHLLLSTAHLLRNLEKIDGLTKEDVADITIPVVLLLGDQDRVVTKEETALMNSWLRKGETKVISHSKHELEKSNLKEITDTVINLLD
jgi:alpha-beta hydrolase superfamily lysophospholipase